MSSGKHFTSPAGQIAASASPGFTWGRSGSLAAGAWLQNDSVPSNVSGRTVALADPEITKVYVANEDPDVFTLRIYEHEGAEVNLTSLGTVTTSATRSNNFDVSFFVTSGRQLAVRVDSGSAKNIVVGLQLRGSVL